MNANRTLVTRFGPETRFDVKPAPAATFRAVEENELERLKRRLLASRLADTTAPEVNVRLRRAANEAASLAWSTGYPLLVFPVLFDELARAARLQARRQDLIRERSRELLVAA